MRISDWSSDVCSSDLLNHGVGPGPVGGRQREDVWEDTTVRGIRATVAHGDDRRFIGGCAFNQGVGDTGGERIPYLRLVRAGAVEALVAFYAPVVVVGGIAFLVVDAYAVNAAVALIEHREVVAKTICKGNAARREGAGAILQAGEVLRFLCTGVDRSKRRRLQHRGGRGCPASGRAACGGRGGPN